MLLFLGRRQVGLLFDRNTIIAVVFGVEKVVSNRGVFLKVELGLRLRDLGDEVLQLLVVFRVNFALGKNALKNHYQLVHVSSDLATYLLIPESAFLNF